jgi:hypothetical protein
MTLPQVCLVDHEQNLWMSDCYSDGKWLMTPERVMAVVHASRNETGRVYDHAMCGGRDYRHLSNEIPQALINTSSGGILSKRNKG